MPSALPVLRFATASAFRDWLHENHETAPGFWLSIAKKGASEESISYAEALDQALCFGWIDGQRQPHDAVSWHQKFTPRRARSGWSQKNTQHVERLTKAGLMMPAGLQTVADAKADGRWDAAYASPRNARPPADFLQALEADQPARAFFLSLNRANVYSIVYRLETARKPETRARRLKMILEMMQQGKKFHP